MEKITISASRNYDILIENGLRKKIKDFLPQKENCKYILLTDENVNKFHADELVNELEGDGYEVLKYVVQPGEESKSMETLQKFLEFMAVSEVNASDILLAFGGGVIGDLGGFAAGIYRRGIEYIQIPTTLLAQVDSSVGGKTAVNLNEGKNLIGLFKQPMAVFCDPEYFKTLDDKDFIAGKGEVIKYGILFDKNLFDKLYNGINKNEDLTEVVKTCINLKKIVVQKDEHDNGERQLLNLGHTIAHAIEIQSNYDVLHGYAVAIGTAIMARACFENGILKDDPKKIETALTNNGLEINTKYSIDDLILIMERDKKRRGSRINEIMIEEIGKCCLKEFDFVELKKFVEKGM